MLENILLVVSSIVVGIVIIGAALYLAGFLVSMPLALVEAVRHREHHTHHPHSIGRVARHF